MAYGRAQLDPTRFPYLLNQDLREKQDTLAPFSSK
jgi:hypothetical protein